MAMLNNQRVYIYIYKSLYIYISIYLNLFILSFQIITFFHKETRGGKSTGTSEQKMVLMWRLVEIIME